MLKRGSIAVPLHAAAEDGRHHEVPPGPCWVMEGLSWVTVIWREADAIRAEEFAVRHYERLKQCGHINFDVVHLPTPRRLLSMASSA